jgi:hypothetical protein
MKITVPHAVVASGYHHRSGTDRLYAGIVETEIAVEELSENDVALAFKIEAANPSNDRRIITYNNALFERSKVPLQSLIDERFILTTEFRNYGGFLDALFQYLKTEGKISELVPKPRAREFQEPAHKLSPSGVSSFVKQLKPLPSEALSHDVEIARSVLQQMWSHIILVDGEVYWRVGVPLYQVTNKAIKEKSSTTFWNHIDDPYPKELKSYSNLSMYDLGVYMRPDQWEEARQLRAEFAALSGTSTVDFPESTRIIQYEDCNYPTLEQDNLIHVARLCLEDAKYQMDSLNSKAYRYNESSIKGKEPHNVLANKLSKAASNLSELLYQKTQRTESDTTSEFDLTEIQIPLTKLSKAIAHVPNVSPCHPATKERAKIIEAYVKKVIERYEDRDLMLTTAVYRNTQNRL